MTHPLQERPYVLHHYIGTYTVIGEYWQRNKTNSILCFIFFQLGSGSVKLNFLISVFITGHVAFLFVWLPGES